MDHVDRDEREEKELLRRLVHSVEHMVWFLAVIAQNQSQGLSPEDTAAVKAATEKMKAGTDKLNAAIAANALPTPPTP